jgi:hypothetical protein
MGYYTPIIGSIPYTHIYEHKLNSKIRRLKGDEFWDRKIDGAMFR